MKNNVRLNSRLADVCINPYCWHMSCEHQTDTETGITQCVPNGGEPCACRTYGEGWYEPANYEPNIKGKIPKYRTIVDIHGHLVREEIKG